MIFDAHSDFGLFLFKESLDGRRGALAKSHYDQLLQAGIVAEVLTVGGDFSLWGINFKKAENVLKTIDTVREEIEYSEGCFCLIENEEDFNKISNSAIGILLALEGATPLAENPDLLDTFYSKGIRSVMLTANQENTFSGGCQTPEIGLSSFGNELIRRISKKPMMLDLAHISERAFFEVIDNYAQPVIVSHANVRKLSNHFRNLSDEQLLCLAERHGVIGISLISLFIENNPLKRTSLSMYKEHLMHAAGLIGMQSIGVGADMMDYMVDAATELINSHNLPLTMFSYPEGIENTADIHHAAYTIQESFPSYEAEAIMFGNFASAYRNALKAK